MEKFKKYLENPFILAGGIGLLVFAYMKWNESRTNAVKTIAEAKPKDEVKDDVKDEVKEEVQAETTSKFDGLPDEFFADVKKMDKKELKHTIKLNKGLAKTKNLKSDEKTQINLMLEYLKEEYAKR